MSSRYWDSQSDEPKFWPIIRDIILIVVFLIAAGMAGCPLYNVWTMGLAGQAELRRAEQTRQILITQAEAERDAAKARAQAIEIIGKSAKEFPEYRQQEFIGAFAHALERGNIAQIIYVPTEANIPILEAGKR